MASALVLPYYLPRDTYLLSLFFPLVLCTRSVRGSVLNSPAPPSPYARWSSVFSFALLLDPGPWQLVLPLVLRTRSVRGSVLNSPAPPSPYTYPTITPAFAFLLDPGYRLFGPVIYLVRPSRPGSGPPGRDAEGRRGCSPSGRCLSPANFEPLVLRTRSSQGETLSPPDNPHWLLCAWRVSK
jgi:hypothetical protein